MASHAEVCNGCDYCANTSPCQRAALSVFCSRDEALSVLKSGGRFKGISSATLGPEHGKLAQTGNNRAHHSLWLRAEALAAATTLFGINGSGDEQ